MNTWVIETDPRIRLFWSYVDTEGDCWEWQRQRHPAGYGQFWIAERGRSCPASRLAYEWSCGPIPPGLLVRHSCDNPPCVRPSHLVLGTHADNARDKVERGRARGNGKFSDIQVANLRLDYIAGVPIAELATKYGMGQSSVSTIGRGLSRRYVPGPVSLGRRYPLGRS